MKTVTLRRLASAGAFSIVLGQASAGPLDPDCTAEKAAKSAAMKATVGVGGRCSPKGGRRRHRKAHH